MGLQKYGHSEEHLEDASKVAHEAVSESGLASPQIGTAGECRVDIASCIENDNVNIENYTVASTAPLDGPLITPSKVPIVTFTLETPPRDPEASFLNVSVSSANSCYSSMGPMCRICHEGDSFEELISPCKCTGSLALVHKGCLERWLNLSSGDKCELCRHTFSISRTPRPFWQSVMCENGEIRRSIIVDLTCFLILTPLAVLSLYLCISSAIFYSKHSSTRANKGPSLKKTEHWKVVLARSLGLDDRNVTIDTTSSDKQYETVIGWDIIGLVMLALLLLGIYIAWLAAAIIYHVKTYQRWHNVNQNLVLADNQHHVSIENQRRPSCFSIISRSYEQMEEEDTPDIFSISNIRSPVDLSFSPAARYLDRDTEEILYSRSAGRIQNTPDVSEKYLYSKNFYIIEHTPAISERRFSSCNIETPFNVEVKSLILEELSVNDTYDCISLNDSAPSSPSKFNSSCISVDESLPNCRKTSISAGNRDHLPPLPLSPCVPRYDL